VKPRPPLPAGPYLIVGLARSGLAAGLALRARGETVIGLDAGTPDGAHALAEAGAEVHLGAGAARASAAGEGAAREGGAGPSAAGEGAAREGPAREGGAGAGKSAAGEGVTNDSGAPGQAVGDDAIALLDRVAAVVKSPGVPGEAPVIATARARGVPVLGELELGWRLLENELIAVTGTNGKTTTVELIGHIHRAAGLPVAVAGNVGAALSGLVGRVEPDVAVVCEASSFQLEDTLEFSPEAAVLLNIAPDHLDRHVTFAAYRHAKLQIFARQTADDVAVRPLDLDVALPGAARQVTFGGGPADLHRGPADLHGGPADLHGGPRSASVTVDGRGETICWQGGSLLDVAELRLRGDHNVQNAMAAAAVCLARGLDPDAIREGLRTFAGVAHRLEEVARRGGVLYVNDSKATNVASTLVALAAFPGATVHLILGGRGKGQDFSALREPVMGRCRSVYLIGESSGALAGALAGAPVGVRDAGELERALAWARAAAAEGDVVLLSPACASFDQFADFEARGERFRELVMTAG
jgi:UDP-N-acetylmuramoylalanine--D-glutamate ligase